MISVQEVVVDPDMTAPKPFTVLRSTGQFVMGGNGFNSTTTSIPMFGPVQQATDKEVAMLPEADRISAVRSFWSTQPIYETRSSGPVPSTHGEVPSHLHGLVYALSSLPEGPPSVYSAGLLLQAGVGYTLSGTTLTFISSPINLYVTWPTTANVATNASDKIEYGNEVYRVLRVYFDPGGGYFKAYGTRMAAS